MRLVGPLTGTVGASITRRRDSKVPGGDLELVQIMISSEVFCMIRAFSSETAVATLRRVLRGPSSGLHNPDWEIRNRCSSPEARF